MNQLTELAQALVNLDEDNVNSLVKAKLEAGVNPLDIISECNKGMTEIGKLFEKNEYFLSELIMSGEIIKAVMEELDPLLAKAEQTASGDVVVIGTVKDDIHDIGKNVVVTLLRGTGFKVVDLGVDVPSSEFVKAVKETGAKVVGLSCLLSFTFPEMKRVVEALKEGGDQVKVIIGGGPCNEDVREFTGADYFAGDAAVGIKICKQVYGHG